MQQDGSAGRHSRLLRNKPARSDGGSVANCRNLRDPQSALLQPMRGRPLNGHGKLQGDFPLHFPLSVTCESAGSCRQPPPVAAVRAISPGDFRSLARKKWEVRKNIPHRIWLRVGPQGFSVNRRKRLLNLRHFAARRDPNPTVTECYISPTVPKKVDHLSKIKNFYSKRPYPQNRSGTNPPPALELERRL